MTSAFCDSEGICVVTGVAHKAFFSRQRKIYLSVFSKAGEELPKTGYKFIMRTLMHPDLMPLQISFNVSKEASSLVREIKTRCDSPHSNFWSFPVYYRERKFEDNFVLFVNQFYG